MMQDCWLEFLQVAGAHLLAVASPGPDFAIVLKQSLTYGRRTALRTSLGVGAAILLHVTYSLLGLGLLIRGSAWWFNVVKCAGAAYIAWLGVQSLRAKPKSEADVASDPINRVVPERPPDERAAFMIGFLTNALNPKATLFFISLFVLIVSPRTPKIIQAGYGLWMAAATAGWFSLVAILFTRPAVRGKFLRYGHWVDRALGVVFLAFAISLVSTTLK